MTNDPFKHNFTPDQLREAILKASKGIEGVDNRLDDAALQKGQQNANAGRSGEELGRR
jgi:hypothetical protein